MPNLKNEVRIYAGLFIAIIGPCQNYHTRTGRKNLTDISPNGLSVWAYFNISQYVSKYKYETQANKTISRTISRGFRSISTANQI